MKYALNVAALTLMTCAAMTFVPGLVFAASMAGSTLQPFILTRRALVEKAIG